MAGGIAFPAAGLLLLTRLSESSRYPVMLLSLVLVGIGNGTAFVPLTATALSGVAPADAGAASVWSTSCSNSAARSASPCS